MRNNMLRHRVLRDVISLITRLYFHNVGHHLKWLDLVQLRISTKLNIAISKKDNIMR